MMYSSPNNVFQFEHVLVSTIKLVAAPDVFTVGKIAPVTASWTCESRGRVRNRVEAERSRFCIRQTFLM